ncbi:MAG: hypothetical protein SFV18_16055 [Bryobacteraceae bacterium]|nr:hypothetical protein [Bryobacteraceae bacterium]
MLAANLSPECISAPEHRTGIVEVFAFDATGARLPNVRAALYSGKDLVASMNKGLIRVPYGRYRLRVEELGFAFREVELAVLQQELTVRVELKIGTLGCASEPRSISGRISGLTRETEVWVKAVPLRGVGGFETRATPRGFYLLAGLEESDYVVMVVAEKAVLAQQVVSTLNANRQMDFAVLSK